MPGAPWETYAAAAQQLLAGAMLAANFLPPQAMSLPPAAATAAALGAFRAGQQQRLWHLRSYSSNLPHAVMQLAVLPTHSLTHLQLNLEHDTAVDAAMLSLALARLSSLQFLCLESSGCQHKAPPASCLEGIAQLSQLTELQLHNCWSNIDQPLQQLLAQPLPLRKLLLHIRSDLPDLNLAHLTQLEVLEHSWGALTPASVLPQQLQRLQLGSVECAADFVAPMQLPALQWFSFLVRFKNHALLLQLAQHTALQQLALTYDGSDDALATAAVWQQLPQLRELRMLWENSIPTVDQAAAILAGIAAATGLTKLEFSVQVLDSAENEVFGGCEPPPLDVSVCGSLAALQNLQELRLECAFARLAVGDALALTALTNLTLLASRCSCSGEQKRVRSRGIDGTAVAAVVRSLPQLRHFELDDCSMMREEALAAIGRLVQLTQLRLGCAEYGEVTHEGLALLTRLSRLQQLTLQASRQVSDAALRKFGQLQGIRKVEVLRQPVQPGVVYTFVSRPGEVWQGAGDGDLEDSDEYEGSESEDSDDYEGSDQYEGSDEYEDSDGFDGDGDDDSSAD
jgi:hypothetical protein